MRVASLDRGPRGRLGTQVACPRWSWLHCLSRDRQEAGHRRPASFLAIDVNGAAVLFADLVADRQPETEATVSGGEEGVEDLRPRRSGNSVALVGHLRLDHRARAAA